MRRRTFILGLPMTYVAFISGATAAGDELWGVTLYDLSGSDELWLAHAVFMSAENEFMVGLYTMTGLEFWRYSTDTFEPIANLASLTDDWRFEYDWFYDPDGYVWMPSIYWNSELGRINTSDWSVDVLTLTPVAVPAPLQYRYGTTLLNTGYYVPFINPFNNAFYAGDLDSYSAFHRINKTTGQPDQTYYMAPENMVLTSPYEGIADSTFDSIFLASRNFIFVSETEAYTRHYNSAEFFHVDLDTGVFTFVFRMLMDPEGRYVMASPIYYDAGANILWIISHNHSNIEQLSTPPAFKRPSFWAWEVGTHPDTMVEYPFTYDMELLDGAVAGDQEHYMYYLNYMVDTFNGGAWVSLTFTSANYAPTTPAGVRRAAINESTGVWCRFFSFTDAAFTKFGVDTGAPAYDLTDYSGAFMGSPNAMVSANTGWFTRLAGPGGSNNEVVAKFEMVGARAIETMRYVRVTILACVTETHASGLGGPTGLQALEVRSIEGGANEAVDVVASSEDPSLPASNLLLADFVDPANGWRAADTSYPQTLTIDLGSAKPIYEVALWPLNLRETGVNVGHTGYTYPTGTFIAPLSITIETSNDGEAWTMKTQYQPIVAWPVQYISASDPSSPRVFLAY
jgi:hypothetical protein